ncbi:MAG: starch-binding protein, partial [Prevotella sp.]|nr:starch-binding protein [Prevotella sp.]
VGVEDVINGDAAWDPTATANDMTENAGVWTLTVEGANLEAGQEYLYKMVKNHDWGDGEVPAQGNQTLTVEETAEYTITYTFDGTTLSCNATKAGGDEPVDGQELVNGEHKVVIKGVHYLNLAENNYVLTIKSEETMTGLGGSFWHTSAGDKDIRENMTVAEDGKTITLTATSTTDPQLYTPLYVLIKDVNEVNFGNVTIEWQEEGEVQNSVTFVNSRDWATVYAYTFDGDGEVLGAWPGTEMTKTDATVDGHDVYTIDITGAPLMIIFHNNAGVQTPNYEFVNGKQYDYPEAKNYTAKFVNIPGWSSVNTYVFNGSVNNGWPGQVATADGTKANVFGGEFDVYTATASLSVDPATIIFNNGDGTQTGDLPFVEGATYSWGSDITEGYFLFTDDADQFMPKQNYDVAGAKASYARKFTPNNVCTVVLPFAIGADVAKAAGKFYRINSIADGYIRGTEETPAPYIPYIFIPAKEYPFTNIGIGQLPEVQNNSITTAEGYTLQFVTETTELASDASYDYYGFQGGKFVKAAYATVNPFRSYIKVAKSANAPATLIWTDDEATGISSLKADIQNGKADVYDLQGRRVLNPVRGLYIVNGKKVIVK